MQDVIACARRAGAHRTAFICFAAFAAFASFRDARACARVPAGCRLASRGAGRVRRRRAHPGDGIAISGTRAVRGDPRIGDRRRAARRGRAARAGRVAEKTSAAGRERIARLPSEFRVNGCPNR
ncbi:hypothetical protein BMMON2_40260 [Burkholderia mallei]